MHFIADLHIHSRFSRATSRQLTPQHLAAWAMIKGLHVLGTGDFTHPGWRKELAETLVRDEASGLYRLRQPVSPALVLPDVTGAANAPQPLFLPQAEISSIYKRHGKVRKVHSLVFMPDLDSAEKFSRVLEGVGNLAADGRPILGLDTRDLLEMVLETDPRGALVPAHVWTPWFAIFGSKSGFDSVEECFGDLTPHIFALETGLSSDPDMNRLWSQLDGYSLISNSDAHSGANLGREANLFTGLPSYDGMFDALRRQPEAACRRPEAACRQPEAACRQPEAACRHAGTVEFFPEEGKYHLDGHRACNVVLAPEESRKLNNICPVCGKPLTIGVLHRVMELADRTAPVPAPGEEPSAFLIPLPELLGELLGVGAQSRKVGAQYARLITLFGSEMDILHTVPEDILRRHWEGLGEGIARMRRGQVIRQGGYDGEYGSVRVFSPQEANSFGAGRARGRLLPPAAIQSLSAPPAPSASPVSSGAQTLTVIPATDTQPLPLPPEKKYTDEQQSAMNAGPLPVLVMAGPGAGKTHTLMGRVEELLRQKTPPHEILVVTFTRRAAEELRQRLHTLLSPNTLNPTALPAGLPRCDTLHALGWARIQEAAQQAQCPAPVLLSEEAAEKTFALANAHSFRQSGQAGQKGQEIRRIWEALSLARETLTTPDTALLPYAEAYAAHKSATRTMDYTDLLEQWLGGLCDAPQVLPVSHVLVDEVQDLSPLQWGILRRLLPSGGQGFFGIGDPDQAIYGFRGAQENVSAFVRTLWPETSIHTLGLSHRAAPGIIACANALLQHMPQGGQCGVLRALHTERPAHMQLFSAPTAESEARWVADTTRRLLGHTAHTLQDTAADTPAGEPLSPGDVAVLVRLKAQIPPLHKALVEAGIPCAVPEQEGCWHDAQVGLLLERAREYAASECLPLPASVPKSVPTSVHGSAPGSAQDGWPETPVRIWRQGLPALGRHLRTCGFADALFWDSAPWKALRALWKTGPQWGELLAQVALLRDIEMVRHKAERVQIMTLHASKGLEFAAVFLPGFEQGLLPLDRTLLWRVADQHTVHVCARQMAEEYRLAYVGITRAARLLFCSHAASRRWQGRELHLAPSPLLEALRPLCQGTRLQKHIRSKAEQLRLF